MKIYPIRFCGVTFFVRKALECHRIRIGLNICDIIHKYIIFHTIDTDTKMNLWSPVVL